MNHSIIQSFLVLFESSVLADKLKGPVCLTISNYGTHIMHDCGHLFARDFILKAISEVIISSSGIIILCGRRSW